MKYYVTAQPVDASAPLGIAAIYRAILCDAIARHRRMCGFDVAYLIATDRTQIGRSGAPPSEPTPSARSDGAQYREVIEQLEVQATHFQSSSAANHVRAVEAMLRQTTRLSRLAIYKGPYVGRFCNHDQIDVSDSKEPAACPKCGRAADLVSEQRYFFRLPSFQSRLDALYKFRPEFIQPHALLPQVQQALAKGLKDIPISVTAGRGAVAWPDDPECAVSSLYSDMVMYLSGIGFGDDGVRGDEFRQLWPAKGHVVGPEEFLPHAVYWPAFLMAADLPLPRRIFTHAMLHADADALALLRRAAATKSGSDALRYQLLHDVQYVDDSRLELDEAAAQAPAKAIDNLQALTKRVVSLTRQHSQGKVPPPGIGAEEEPLIESFFADLRAEVRILLDANNFSEALPKIWSLVELIAQRLDRATANAQSGHSSERQLQAMLHDACEGMGWIALLLHPILPRVTESIWRALGQTTQLREQLIDETPWSCLMPGTPLREFAE